MNDVSLEHKVKKFTQALHRQELDALAVVKDTALINKLADANEPLADLNYLYDKPYTFFIYKRTANSQYLKFWNSALVIVPDSILLHGQSEKMVELENGYYLIKALKYIQDTTINIYTAILVQSKFPIESEYFKQSFPLYPGLDKIADLSTQPTSYSVQSVSGKIKFYIKQKTAQFSQQDSVLFVMMRLICFSVMFFLVYLFIKKGVEKINKRYDIPVLLGCVIVFRLLLYFLRDIFKLDSLELFNNDLYDFGLLIPSLGDLLINSVLFCCLGLFIWKRGAFLNIKNNLSGKENGALLKGIFYILVLLSLLFVIVNIIRSIVSNSDISFDVTNFFSLSIYTAVGFVIIVFLTLGFHFFSRIIYHYLFPSFANRILLIYLLIPVFGLAYIAIGQPHSVGLYLLCTLWLLVYTFLFNNEIDLNKLIRFNISGIVIWIFIFSISISALMLSEIDKAELKQRKLYLEKLETKSEPATERLIVIANTYLDSTFFRENFERLYNPTQNKFLRDSILSNNYSRYIRDYTGILYFFDSTNAPLYNGDELSYESINTIISRQSSPTKFPDLYFYEPSYDKFAYLTYRKVKDISGHLIGTVCIISQPKKFSTVRISPELFRQYNDWEFSNSPVYNYAIYSNKLLVASSKKYPFTSTLETAQLPKATFELRTNNGYSELWYKGGNKKVMVMTRKSEGLLEMITLFSYIFCAFLLLLAIIQLGSNIANFILNKQLSKQQFQFATSIRGQIHNTFIFITLLSFLVIGIATISFFTQRFDDSNAEHLGRTMNIMLNEMQSHKDLGMLVYEQGDSSNQKMEDIIKRIADIHGVDVNVYNFKGSLLTSSQPDIYRKGILSKMIDPRAYYYLLRMRHIEHTQKEKVANLTYTNMYAPLRNQDGTFYAYLSIPYFTSEQVLNEEISRFLVTLINLNAFIFLITGLVALFITNRITHSFALIKEKLMQINLSKHNDMIVWDKQDEIGSLVAEYNKMVEKLQLSVSALAKSERQEAWREMARQVAHEIKNPLTPMKLSLQYLQRAIDNDSPNIQQLTFNVSQTLVEQIDHLAKIAADFSQFANINHVNTEVFDLHEVIKPLVILYSKNPDVELIWKPIDGVLNILADKTQINRVFTNLLINAVEAVKANTICQIIILEKADAFGKVIISVADNGMGIAEDMIAKIFTPNFTTKSSGTGLGLAMCKTIIEQAGGAISFQTEADKGTTFKIELPLIST